MGWYLPVSANQHREALVNPARGGIPPGLPELHVLAAVHADVFVGEAMGSGTEGHTLHA